MKCPGCDAENTPDRKFCKSCGSPLGVLCDRCGVVNEGAALYCGACGFGLAPSLKSEADGRPGRAGSAGPGSGQYSESDIRELMILRERMKKEEEDAENLRQDDITKLFG